MNDLKTLLHLIQSMPQEFWFILIPGGLIVFASWWGTKKHLLCTLEAGRHLKRIKKLQKPDHQVAYLRKVNPFVFEEMILTAIKRQGHQIKRNKRYTGDGGIDGRCFIKGKEYLIQAKRYSNHINAQHVIEFAGICKRHNAKGLFVHTGKTGAKSKDVAHRTNIEMISGERLLNLLLNKPKEHSQNRKNMM